MAYTPYADRDNLAEYARHNLNVMAIVAENEDTDRQDAALSQATKIIDRLNFIGDPESEDNAFPRTGQTAVPTAIVEACMEIAVALLDGVNPDLEAELLQHKQDSLDSARTTYDRAGPIGHVLLGVPSLTAWRLLLPYLKGPNSIDLRRV